MTQNKETQELIELLSPYQYHGARLNVAKSILIVADLLTLWGVLALTGYLSLIKVEHGWVAAFQTLTLEMELFRLGSFLLVSTGLIAWFWIVCRHYSNRRPYWDELKDIVQGIAASFVLDAALAFLSKNAFSRSWLISLWLSLLIFLPFMRWLVKNALSRSSLLDQPYIIVGAGAEVQETIAALESEPLVGFKALGIVLPYSNASQLPFPELIYTSSKNLLIPTYPLTDELEFFLCNLESIKVIFVLGDRDTEQAQRLRKKMALVRDNIYLVPAISGLPLYGMETYNFFSHEVLLLRANNNLKRRGPRLLKRLFDIFASATLLTLIFPLLLYVAYRIRRESHGSAIFTQQRVGYNGESFEIYKFRSMVQNADEVLEAWRVKEPELWDEYVQNNFKLANDPRVTPIGRWIRRASIDELPQLINVLKGQMSLVGPRPLLERELDSYGESIDIYGNVRPGITGLWQISGRSNTTFEKRVAMDRWYIRNWSLWHDIVILFRTVSVVLKNDGAS
jgi:Undecaprenyl-phosphate galactose phosphotransferase WbaP